MLLWRPSICFGYGQLIAFRCKTAEYTRVDLIVAYHVCGSYSEDECVNVLGRPYRNKTKTSESKDRCATDLVTLYTAQGMFRATVKVSD